jgi:NADP-reducing hydrogenase subunit HndD
VGGGGQPLGYDMKLRGIRGDTLYAEDKQLARRRSHENPAVKRLYKEFLKEPCGHKSHELLHTAYIMRDRA